MLMIQRRPGQRIVLSGGVEILVSTVRNGSVRLAIVAPRGVLVLRGEIHDRIAEANASASSWDGANVTAEGTIASVDVFEEQPEMDEKKEVTHEP